MIDGIGTNRPLNQANINIDRAQERIASGQQINRAADDAAGFAIANRQTSQINEFSQAARNANDGISLIQTADGGLSSITENLQRIRELSLQAANGTLTDSDRQFLNREAQQLKDEISQTIEQTSFNDRPVFESNQSTTIQLGAEQQNSVELNVSNLSDVLEGLNFDDLDISSASGAASALSTVDTLQNDVDDVSANLGAQANRLESSINALFDNQVNAQASRSRIADADIARESTALTINEVQRETAISLTAQANSRAQDVLRLLGQ